MLWLYCEISTIGYYVFNTWSSTGGTVWEGCRKLGGEALLKEGGHWKSPWGFKFWPPSCSLWASWLWLQWAFCSCHHDSRAMMEYVFSRCKPEWGLLPLAGYSPGILSHRWQNQLIWCLEGKLVICLNVHRIFQVTRN